VYVFVGQSEASWVWVAQCAEDLVVANYPVRSVAAVVEKLD
jgi:hypothetical protein